MEYLPTFGIIWAMFWVHVGKYSSTMDPMGILTPGASSPSAVVQARTEFAFFLRWKMAMATKPQFWGR